MSDQKQSGFTLIELVMVIVIIGVLSAIIVPNFVDYVGKSAASTTKANLQILRTAVQTYKADNNNAFPATLATLVPTYLPSLPKDGKLGVAAEQAPPADDGGGWTYVVATGVIKPNLLGNDAYSVDFQTY